MQQFFSPCSAPENKPEIFLRHSRKRRARRQASGFTLIEVMVALIIFVGGALAIVRIFPGALAVVQTSETRAIGTRMAQATLARFESQPFTIPEAIYDFDSALLDATNNPYSFSDFNGAVVGTVSRNASLPRESQRFDPLDLPSSASSYNANRSPISQSALGRFRRVAGEKQRIRQIGSSPAVITRFPYLPANFSVHRDHVIEGLRIDDQTGTFNFSDATINGISIGDTTNPQQPATTYNNAALTYYVSYRYVRDNRIQGVTDEPIRFTGTGTPPIRVLQSGTGRIVIDGPIKAYLREPINGYPAPTASDPNPIRGYLNLTGATPALPTDNTGTGDTLDVNDLVGVDYIVADWRWLVADDAPSTETDIPPATGASVPRAMPLASRHVLDEPAGNTTLHALLIGRDATNQTVRFNGEWIAGVQGDKFGEYPGSSFPDMDRVQSINQKSGRVLFDVKDISPLAAPNTPLRSPRARVVYRNLDGWGHQIAVAAKSYVPFDAAAPYGPNHPREPWREYFHNSTTDNRFLFFHPSEAGKTVMVSFEYLEGSVHRRISDAVVTISDTLVERTSIPATLAPPDAFFLSANTSSGAQATKPKTVAVAELANLEGSLIGTDNSLTGNGALTKAGTVTAITSVRGASIRARTAWFDGNSYSQVAVSGFRPLD